MKRETIGWRAVLSVMLAVVVLLVPAAVAAQEDPYGPTTTTTTTPPEHSPVCQTEHEEGQPGARTTVQVHHVPLGATVRIFIGGQEAGQATAPSDGPADTVSLTIEVVIPDLEPGQYNVVAVGPGFSVSCGVAVTFNVLSSGDGSGGSGFDVLAFTGMNLLLLLLIALVLLLAGRQLVKWSRRTRARSQRRRAVALTD